MGKVQGASERRPLPQRPYMNRFLTLLTAVLGVMAVTALPASARSHHHARHAAAPHASAARPGQLQYIVVQDFNPRLFDSAARTARDAVRDGSVRQFRIVLAARGVLLAIRPITNVQREVGEILRKNPRVQLVACKEVVSALTKVAHRPPPLMPGTHVMPCNGLHVAMERGGWQVAAGF
jgi:hypothetical protein